MGMPRIFRTRYIPFETVDISSDELLFRNDEMLVTRWKAIKPRDDISGGISYTFPDRGYKISRFFDAKGLFAYWYCDIVDVIYDQGQDIYLLHDLLLDIKVMPDGSEKVLDADELAEAAEKGLITMDQVCRALRRLDELLKMIYSGDFPPEQCKEEY